jgi:hypothetical protein
MWKSSSAQASEPVLSVRAIVLSALGLFILTCGAIVLAIGSNNAGTQTDLGEISTISSLLAGAGGVAAFAVERETSADDRTGRGALRAGRR